MVTPGIQYSGRDSDGRRARVFRSPLFYTSLLQLAGPSALRAASARQRDLQRGFFDKAMALC